jgi:PAS domain S-box-containing protein
VPFPWKHAGIAAATILAATAARWALNPLLDFHVPYVTYFVAIVFIAWRTTTPVTLASVAASWAAGTFLFIAPAFSFIHLDVASWIGSIAFFAVGIAITLIADRMRRALDRSARSEQQLDQISRRLPALVSYVGPDRRYVWCNEEYTRWFGLSRETIVGRTMEEVLGAQAWRKIEPQVAAALDGNVVEYESEVPYAHGGTRWIHVTYTPHRDDAGAIRGMIAMVTDISDRKRAEQGMLLLADLSQPFASDAPAEEAARQVTERLVERLGLSRCLLAEIDDDADVVRVIHQHPGDPDPDATADFRTSEFLNEEERRLLAEGRPLVINDVRTGRNDHAAQRFRALGVGAVVSAPYLADGKRKFALAAEKREPYEWKADEVALLREVAARVCVHLDRARAEQTLRDSELRYRSLANVLSNIPCAVDPIGRFVEPQPAWARYTGQGFERSRDFGWFDAVHPDDRVAARAAWVEALHARKPYEVRVRIWHAPSRTFRHVIARATPLMESEERIREWVGAVTDIHEETEQARALVEADRRKDEFLATLAHELRNPLAPIRNSLNILKLTGKAEGALANVYQILDRQVSQMVRLVDDLMEVSRITRGHVSLRTEPTDVQAILLAAIETSRPLIEEAAHRLDVSLPPESLRLNADPMRLAQVITNLLNNAARYTDKGGLIQLSARREGEEAVVSVRDNGRGISADMLPRVFDLFTQAAPNRQYSHGSLGIGLTIVRSLVELHGGRVEARSEGPRRGSEFIVRLPLAGTARTAAGAAPEPGPRSHRNRVLVVDDNRDAAESLGVLLALLGIETMTAHSGPAALEALDEFRPSVILLDLGMPGMDGYEVAQRVRQHPFGRRVTLVALTGWGLQVDRQKSEDVGFDHHLVKPVDVEVLRQVLDSIPEVARSA